MNEHWTYFMVNIGAISIPFLFSFHPRLRFDKTWFAFFPAMLIVGAFFIVWDVWFTDMGIWGFNSRYLLGIDILNLPIEEWLFFLCIPYACTFTYHCLKILIQKDFLGKYQYGIGGTIAIVLFFLGIIYFGKWYTSLTFLLTSFFLATLILLKFKHLGRFFIGFIAILPFFFLTNGILTGSGIEDQVVWYNDNENLGIRMGTIPVEDVFYGMLLLVMNVSLYEFFLKKRNYKLNAEVPR